MRELKDKSMVKDEELRGLREEVKRLSEMVRGHKERERERERKGKGKAGVQRGMGTKA